MFPLFPRVFAGAVLCAALLATTGAARAGDAQAGRKKARVCQTCHGIDGTSKLAEAPNLSGQVETYLVKALHDFKSGARKNEMMTLIVEPLGDTDIADLAAWYSSIEVTVTKPQ
jgi:cytochrome c553